MDIQVVAFDTGGTVLDWHGGLVNELTGIDCWQTIRFDRHEFVNTWRRKALQKIIGNIKPEFNMDHAHLVSLRETISTFDLPLPNDDDLARICNGWHRLRAWSDFLPAQEKLRKYLPVISFTMLPTALVMNVSRSNGIYWDAIISCEMIGVYKPKPEAYRMTARWLGIAPENILMVACHNFDLNAAQDTGFRTAFIRRPNEWGPAGPPDPEPNRTYDHVCDDFDGLVAEVMGHK
ncbi:MAG: HAD-IA family hydrolase [Burkholderiaceae bacterium]|jgi:2-haloacid dehalogenase